MTSSWCNSIQMLQIPVRWFEWNIYFEAEITVCSLQDIKMIYGWGAGFSWQFHLRFTKVDNLFKFWCKIRAFQYSFLTIAKAQFQKGWSTLHWLLFFQIPVFNNFVHFWRKGVHTKYSTAVNNSLQITCFQFSSLAASSSIFILQYEHSFQCRSMYKASPTTPSVAIENNNLISTKYNPSLISKSILNFVHH